MSSMRNAVQRRNHRERGQPEERQKWGLLEKHKDYSLRAKDFNRKKATLKSLTQKAASRNPDEFYFGMMSKKGPSSGKGQNGTVNGDRGGKAMGVEAVRLLKTQDLGYVRTVRNKVQREVEGLRARVKGIEGEGRKVVWVEGGEELRRRKRSAVEEVDGEDGDEEEDDELEEEMDKSALRRRRMREKEEERLERRLKVAEERLKALTEAEEALDLQRARMAKTSTVGGVTKKGVKFRVRERKR